MHGRLLNSASELAFSDHYVAVKEGDTYRKMNYGQRRSISESRANPSRDKTNVYTSKTIIIKQ